MTQSGENAYTILETLHRSKHFFVYKAKNYFRGNFVTIKSIEQRWRSDPSINRQLRFEAEAGLRLRHAAIRQTIGLFEDDGTIYMVSEFIPGDSLNTLLSIPKIDISYAHARKWLIQLLEAMNHAHAQRIIHINLNPQNIIVTPDYDAKLFGFGKPPGAWKTAEAERGEFHPLLFSAPEIFMEDNPDERSDVYSLGVLGYLLFTGQLPWSIDRHESPSTQKQQTLERPILSPDLLPRRIPHWLFTVLNKALMLDPARRFATADEMLKAIEAEMEIPFEISQQGFTAHNLPQGSLSSELPLEPKTQAPPKAETPIPTSARTRPPQTSVRPGENKAQERQDLDKMKRLARRFGIAALIILGYIIVKYVIISDKPRFSKVEGQQASVEKDTRIPNEPVALVLIPGGTALIGSSSSLAEVDETPVLEVKLSSFHLGATEVTRAQWAMITSGYAVSNDEKELPVTNVSFLEVVDYCNAKSRAEGLDPCYKYIENGIICDFNANGYRLPTEAEWEYAARGTRGGGAKTYSGSDYPGDVAWYSGNSDSRIHPVKKKNPNSLGLYDMSGNAAEWVWNWYARYTNSEDNLYAGPSIGIDRIARGGSWRDQESDLRNSRRHHFKPFTRSGELGFRVARTKK